MGLIPEEIIAQVLDRSDIAEVIGGYLPLKRAGRNFKALCPFHNEKTPSFIVNPDKQIFHCFGCGVGGNVFSFVMRQENLDFPEAVRMLAGKVGIAVPQGATQDKGTLSLKELLYKSNEQAVFYFHDNLIHGKNPAAVGARTYLQRRGIKLETAKRFKLGFALDRWDGLLKDLNKKGVGTQLLEKAGLIIPQEKKDGYYDRFRNRIIFPIFDIRSRPVAFGARAMEETGAKYINSPETAVYTKGQHLYGLYLSKEAIRQKDQVIIAEGYMDFLLPYQYGIQNIVASLGTALTIEQIRLLRRYTKNIIMLLDTDQAGQNAMVRSLDLLIEEGLDVQVASLSAGEDPDSFIRKHGPDAFIQRISAAQPWFDYKLNILMGQHSYKTAEGKAKISGEMLLTINRLKNAVIKFEYIKKLAETIGVSEEALLMELQKIPERSFVKEGQPSGETETIVESHVRVVERNILRLMLEEEETISFVKQKVTPDDFHNEMIRRIVKQIYEMLEQGKKVTVSSLMNCFDEPQVSRLIAQLMAPEHILSGDKERIRQDYVNRIISDRIKSKREHLRAQIQSAERAGNIEKLDKLRQAFNELIKRSI